MLESSNISQRWTLKPNFPTNLKLSQVCFILCRVREISPPWKRSRSHLALTSLLLRPQELPVSNLWRVNRFNMKQQNYGDPCSAKWLWTVVSVLQKLFQGSNSSNHQRQYFCIQDVPRICSSKIHQASPSCFRSNRLGYSTKPLASRRNLHILSKWMWTINGLAGRNGKSGNWM